MVVPQMGRQFFQGTAMKAAGDFHGPEVLALPGQQSGEDAEDAGGGDGPGQQGAVVLAPDQNILGPGPLQVGAVLRAQQFRQDADLGMHGLEGEGGEQGALIHLGRGLPRLAVGQDDGLEGLPDIGLQENLFPGIIPPEIGQVVVGNICLSGPPSAPGAVY